MTDSEAVQALQRGDQRGLEALVERYELRALRTAYHVTRDPESAKDVVADAFLINYRDRILKLASARNLPASLRP